MGNRDGQRPNWIRQGGMETQSSSRKKTEGERDYCIIKRVRGRRWQNKERSVFIEVMMGDAPNDCLYNVLSDL